MDKTIIYFGVGFLVAWLGRGFIPQNIKWWWYYTIYIILYVVAYFIISGIIYLYNKKPTENE